MQWCGICGVFIIYRFNDIIDQTHDLRFNVNRLLHNKLNLFFIIQFVFISFPVLLNLLSPFRVHILLSICFLGILYSINFRFMKKNYRIKNIFILKNLFIGILWGGLILAGAGHANSNLIIGLFAFACIQVLIGSTIRDIPDIDRDKLNNVNSFPAVLGINNSILLLHGFNIFSIILGFIIEPQNEFLLLMGITVAWRFYVLFKIKKQSDSKIWTQTFNLLTCFLIFIISLLQFIYEQSRIHLS